MARPYSGRYSPSPAPQPGAPLPQPRPEPVRRGRTALLALTALPFLLTAFSQDQAGLIASLASAGLILFSAFFTREGQVAQAEYDARKVARRPALPRKLFGALAIGAALGISAGGGVVVQALIGLLAGGLHLAAFGLDPSRDKGAEGVDAFEAERVAKVAAEAERHLAAMRDAISRAGDRALEARVALFIENARAMIRSVEEDPRDLANARRYLGVYLEGARAATARFADIWAQSRNAQARADYEALLNDLERNFAQRRTLLLEDNRTSLNIEIDVLRERLSREGVPLSASASPERTMP